jgi:hypothetical protein
MDENRLATTYGGDETEAPVVVPLVELAVETHLASCPQIRKHAATQLRNGWSSEGRIGRLIIASSDPFCTASCDSVLPFAARTRSSRG